MDGRNPCPSRPCIPSVSDSEFADQPKVICPEPSVAVNPVGGEMGQSVRMDVFQRGNNLRVPFVLSSIQSYILP